MKYFARNTSTVLLLAALSIFSITLSGCGTTMIKDVSRQFEDWKVSIIDLQDEAVIHGFGNVQVRAKNGSRLVKLKMELENTTQARTIDLEQFKIVTDAATHKPGYIRHWFLTSVPTAPKLDAGETIQRILVYGIPKNETVQSLKLPDGTLIPTKN